MNISKAKILSLLDLTSLNDDDTPAVIDALCRNATQAIGKVAAVCVYPPFVAQSRARLPESSGINVATVVNFPTKLTSCSPIKPCSKATPPLAKPCATKLPRWCISKQAA